MTEYEYDQMNRRTLEKLPDPDGNDPASLPQPLTIFRYNPTGTLDEVEDHLGRITGYVYDRLDRLTEETLPDPDPGDGISAPSTTYVYDDVGNLTFFKDARGG